MSRVKGAYEVKEPQRSEGWLRARLGNVTGSDAKKVIRTFTDADRDRAIRKILEVKMLSAKLKTTDSYLDLCALWEENPLALFEQAEMRPPESMERLMYRRTRVAERLTGLESSQIFQTQAMKWGEYSEPLARAKYQLVTKNLVEEAVFTLHPELRCGASPDGKVTDFESGELGVLEIKCLDTHNHLYKIMKKREMPEDYFVQVQMEMWIMDVDFCDFVGYDSRLKGKLDIFIQRIERDNDFIDNVLEPEIIAFLDEVDKDERYFRYIMDKGFEESDS